MVQDRHTFTFFYSFYYDYIRFGYGPVAASSFTCFTDAEQAVILWRPNLLYKQRNIEFASHHFKHLLAGVMQLVPGMKDVQKWGENYLLMQSTLKKAYLLHETYLNAFLCRKSSNISQNRIL
jgi:hypothetical protein